MTKCKECDRRTKYLIDEVCETCGQVAVKEVKEMTKTKEFAVIATPNINTWCDTDRDYYKDDLIYSEEGIGSIIQYFDTATEGEALDSFHCSIPIKCLDDWNIEVHEINLEDGIFRRIEPPKPDDPTYPLLDLIDFMQEGGKIANCDWWTDEYITIKDGYFVDEKGVDFTLSPLLVGEHFRKLEDLV